ncbi:MAG: hypothetical protein MJ252_13025 [archaeon]|nr:hypothetical protein [archaeon]
MNYMNIRIKAKCKKIRNTLLQKTREEILKDQNINELFRINSITLKDLSSMYNNTVYTLDNKSDCMSPENIWESDIRISPLKEIMPHKRSINEKEEERNKLLLRKDLKESLESTYKEKRNLKLLRMSKLGIKRLKHPEDLNSSYNLCVTEDNDIKDNFLLKLSEHDIIVKSAKFLENLLKTFKMPHRRKKTSTTKLTIPLIEINDTKEELKDTEINLRKSSADQNEIKRKEDLINEENKNETNTKKKKGFLKRAHTLHLKPTKKKCGGDKINSPNVRREEEIKEEQKEEEEGHTKQSSSKNLGDEFRLLLFNDNDNEDKSPVKENENNIESPKRKKEKEFSINDIFNIFNDDEEDSNKKSPIKSPNLTPDSKTINLNQKAYRITKKKTMKVTNPFFTSKEKIKKEISETDQIDSILEGKTELKEKALNHPLASPKRERKTKKGATKIFKIKNTLNTIKEQSETNGGKNDKEDKGNIVSNVDCMGIWDN